MLNRSYWGGSNLANVCTKPGQFECWDNRSLNGARGLASQDPYTYEQIVDVVHGVLDGRIRDNTHGSDHYNNPDKEGYPSWTQNCIKTVKIGLHQFYRGK